MEAPSELADAGPAEVPTTRVARVTSALYLLAVVGFVVHVSWHALSSHYTVPNKDDWRILDGMFSTPVAEWILTDQNGHFVPVTLGLLYVDYHLLGGHMRLPAGVSVLALASGLVAIVLVLAPWRRPRDPLGLPALGLACFLFAWGAARHDLVWGLQGSVILAAMWTLVSLGAFGGWLERTHATGASAAPKLLLLSVLAASAATFSQGIGFSVWAGLLAVAVAARVRPRALALLGACAVGALLLYRYGLDPDPGRSSLDAYGSLAASAPTYLVDRALTFVGAPLGTTLASSGLASHASPRALARICGVVGAAAFFLSALRAVSKRARLTRRHALSIGLPTAALAGGLLVALNRAGFADAMTHVRFATWSSLFWVGLAAAISSQTASRLGAWVTVAGTASVALVSALALTALGDARAQQATRRDQLAVVRTLHQLDIRWDRAAGGGTIVKSPERSYRIVDRFRRDERSFLSEPAARLPGSRLTDSAELAPRGRCTGAVTSANRMYARGPFWLVSGWGRDEASKSRIERVAISDGKGIVVGMGVGVRPGTPLVDASLPDEDFPWTGFVRGTLAKGPYTAFGLLDGIGGPIACSLGALERPSERGRDAPGPARAVE